LLIPRVLLASERGSSVSGNVSDNLALEVGDEAATETGRADGELVIAAACGAVVATVGNWWRRLGVCGSEAEGIAEMGSRGVDG